MSAYRKLTININVDLAADLERRASKAGITLTEWFRRAAALQVFIEDHMPPWEAS